MPGHHGLLRDGVRTKDRHQHLDEVEVGVVVLAGDRHCRIVGDPAGEVFGQALVELRAPRIEELVLLVAVHALVDAGAAVAAVDVQDDGLVLMSGRGECVGALLVFTADRFARELGLVDAVPVGRVEHGDVPLGLLAGLDRRLDEVLEVGDAAQVSLDHPVDLGAATCGVTEPPLLASNRGHEGHVVRWPE